MLENQVGAWNEQALKRWNIKQGALNQANTLKVHISPEDRGYHVAPKPLNLLKLLVELVSKEGQIILDPFAGSGTTLLAAKELNRHFLGFENDENIYQIARARLKVQTNPQTNSATYFPPSNS